MTEFKPTFLDALARDTVTKMSRDAVLRQNSPVETLRQLFGELREEGRILGKLEDGWVIEHGESEVSRPRYWGGEHGWTHENFKAVRFCREEDARSMAASLRDPEKHRIAEHCWPILMDEEP